MTSTIDTRHQAMVLIYALLILLIGGAIAITAVSTANAQPAAQDNPLDGDRDDEQQQNESDEEDRNLANQVGQLDILEVDFIDGENPRAEITVEWRGAAPEQVTFTQIDPEQGAAAIERRRIPPDEKITLNIDLVSDQHGLIYSQESITNQRAAVVKFENTESRDVSLLRGIIYGGATFGIATVLMAWRKTRTFGEPSKEDLKS